MPERWLVVEYACRKQEEFMAASRVLVFIDEVLPLTRHCNQVYNEENQIKTETADQKSAF